MDEAIRTLEKYLLALLDIEAKAHPWEGEGNLPLFLTNAYAFYEVFLFKHPCLLMLGKQGVDATPATVKKHLTEVQKKWRGLCIYVQPTISAYNRQRLIHHRVPFIVPGNQMYLPDLGIDFREYFQHPKIFREHLSPSTQAVVIYRLCKGTSLEFTLAALSDKLSYSRMTLTRAFDEFESAKIGKTVFKGRERYWIFEGSNRELWDLAKPLLFNPIKQRFWMRGKRPKIKAGLSALAEYSMLNPPNIPSYAVNVAGWKNLEEAGDVVLPTPEEATAELEVWHYDPALFSTEGRVDPFSLFLSLEENEDERIEMALDVMMERIKW